MQLTDKVALVTGAGSGIGKASAIGFAKAGAKVAVLSHTESETKATADEIIRAGGKAIPIVADVAQPEPMELAFRQTLQEFGGLDIVFANAGINGVQAPVEELPNEEFLRTIHNNLYGTFLTIKYAVPYLKKRGGGSVIITSSINGTRVFSNSGATAYATSKAGQVALGKMLALELAQFRIRVNIICPGAIATGISENTDKRNVEKVKIKAKYEKDHPLSDRPGTSEEVADLALFLASDASKHITGSPIWIDGAESLLRG
ncbi:MAG: SDR family oxidoreductase [Phycisphaerae bacterium]|nr:SDR family oxidoreductase [Phycisphaerae bacterium]